MNASIQRRRLACAECTRRKIKCDKVLPCRNCTRRGTACYRSGQNSISHGRATPLSPRSQRNDEPSALEGNLSACIQELQATLQAVRSRQTSTPRFNDSAVSLPGTIDVEATPALPDRQSPSPLHNKAPGSSPGKDTAEVEDAATILEFLAWGRRKVPCYDDLDVEPRGKQAQSPGDVVLEEPLDSAESPQLRLTDDSSSLAVLQLLLPEPQSLFRIVDYHCECLLWYHSSFHALVFKKEVQDFLDRHSGQIDEPNVDLQWVALLFAVLAGSMTCAPPFVAHSWGFRDRERSSLARRWFKAALVCLNKADFTACHSIYAVQCITTMTISAHMLGHSNSHSVKLATAVRISQSLGLHRLGSPTEDRETTIVRKEIGRRVWIELCIQDWFSIPFSESYLVHLLDFNTGKPLNCKEEDMQSLPDDVPTLLTYHRLLYDIAYLMPKLQDDLSQSNTLYTKYEHVLRYDRKMRTLASQQVPLCLRSTPLDPDWPRYVPWARHCLTISSAHKIIMIHRKFLWPSFSNPVFEFTRKTCIAASKTIIREYKLVALDDGPILWIYHAFSVAAGIILCLDLLFRSPSDAEHQDHHSLVRDTIDLLSGSEMSMIAKRGVTILRLLLQVEQNRRQSQALDQPPETSRASMSHEDQMCALDIKKLVQAVCEQEHSQSKTHISRSHEGMGLRARPTTPEQDVEPEQPGSGLSSPSRFLGRGANTDELFGNLLGPQSRFEIHDSLEEILFLAQNCGS